MAEVDQERKAKFGNRGILSCDTLLLSVGLIPENEISGGMGVEMNPVTSGPKVTESLETNIEGVFDTVETYSMYMIWLTLYPRKRLLQERMRLLM